MAPAAGRARVNLAQVGSGCCHSWGFGIWAICKAKEGLGLRASLMDVRYKKGNGSGEDASGDELGSLIFLLFPCP